METAGLNIIAYSTSFPTPPNGQTTLNHGSPSVARATATLEGQVPGLPTAPHEPYDDRSWYFFLTDIMLRKLEMRIDIYMQEKRREAYRRAGDSPELFFQSLLRALREFDYQATSYYESLPEAMQFPLDSSVPCQDELRQYLRWRLCSARHDISLPALYILLHNDVSKWSETLVSDLVALTNACLELDVGFMRAAGSTHRNHNTWLGLRKGVRSALILIAARRLRDEGRPELAGLKVPDDGVCQELAEVLVRGLRYWESESRDCATNLSILRELHADFRV